MIDVSHERTIIYKHVFKEIFFDPAYERVNHNILSTSTLVSDAVSNGGFGAVVDDGFGVGYATTDDSIGFMISSFKVKTIQKEEEIYLQARSSVITLRCCFARSVVF